MHPPSPSARKANPPPADAWLAAIIESSDDAIISKDLNGIVQSWNRGAERIFGYKADEMVGCSILRLIPAGRRNEEDYILGQIRRGEKVMNFETQRQTKTGALIDVSLTTSPVRNGAGNIVGASKIARDITRAKQRDAEIVRLSRLYAALSQVNQAIVMTETRDELLHKVCKVLVEHGKFPLAWIGWHDPASHQLVPVAVSGDENDYVKQVTIYADDRPEGHGPSGTAFLKGRPCISNDLVNDPVMAPWHAEIVRRGLRASAVFPIHQQGQICGVLNVYAEEPGFFRDKEIALLAEAAGDISFGLGNFLRSEERQRAEANARHEKNFSEAMIDSMPGIVYFYDETGRFLRWNRNFETVSGYSAAEIAGMTPLDFFPETERAKLRERIADVFALGESFVEASFLRKDGSTTPYFFTGRRVSFDGRECLAGVGLDMTARKQAEQALRELNESLEQKVAERTREVQAALERAEAADQLKSAFLATMSHELRTPLNSIIGFTGIVLQGLAGPLNPEQTKQLGMVRSSARHLLELINDVLDISKIEAGQLQVSAEPFDVLASVERVTGLIKPQAERKGLALTTSLPPDLPRLVSDRRRFEQILLNLLNNAVKFTERGGVTLTVAPIAAFRSAVFATPVPALRLTVADTGIGIKPENLGKLFQPFRQIDSGLTRQHEGTGLGLAICSRLCALLHAEITAASIWSKGSEFVCTVPLHPPA